MKLREHDKQLIARIHEDDDTALKELYRLTLPRVLEFEQDHRRARQYLQDALLKLRSDIVHDRLNLRGKQTLTGFLLHLCQDRVEKTAQAREIEHKIYHSLVEVNNDGWAFYYMQVHYFPSISYFVKMNGGSDEEAKDLIMDGIEALINNIRSGKYELRQEASLKTYFYQICKNKWYDYLDKRKRSRPISLFADLELDHFESEYYHAFDEDLLNERQRQVSKVFNEATDSCRNVLRYYYYDELSHDEIANRMGYSGADSSKTQKNKCIRKIKTVLKDWIKTTERV